MKKDVLVKIKAGITSGRESEEIVTKSNGSYFEKNQSIYIIYNEELEDGNTNNCRMKIADEELEIKKTGAYSTLMTFTRDRSTKTCYRTPFGSLNFIIDTKCLDVFISETSIKIKLEYEMGVEGDKNSTHKMEILITEK